RPGRRARLRRRRSCKRALARARDAADRPRDRRRPTRELARTRGNDLRHPEREQTLSRTRRDPPHRLALTGEIRIMPIAGLPEIREGDDLAQLIVARVELEDGDVVVLAQKIVSKSEGRVVRLADVEPSERAREIAVDEDPRRIEVILREAARVVRIRPPLVIAETRHGFICASAGVDASNAPEPKMLVLLPEDPDSSAQRLRGRLLQPTDRPN